MQTQNNSEQQPSTSSEAPKEEDSPPHLTSIFDGMSTTSHAVNRITTPSTDEVAPERPTSVFESLQMLTRLPLRPEEHFVRKRKRVRIHFDQANPYSDNSPRTPQVTHSRWDPPPQVAATALPSVNTLSMFSYVPSPVYPSPIMNDEPMTDDELVKMKGPSRLIGFLVHIAMNEKARRALRWTGNGLEFVLVNKELVAKMWGNRKHNTKDMDYYKLSRAIREKYEKKNSSNSRGGGKLKKGTRTYSYVFTENAYPDLINQTEKSIEFINNFAVQIGNKYHDNSDLNNSNSPQAPSPVNSD
ncbi:unnamed protein product [Caenorhabditis nigoni]|uniref:ETS domain-containing protein n=1 Tax=Caenorhabditis nigoni TaxID=1611254 RepID=A0A2G5SSJ6_9PELO|nr:hypothetical protein B9Z55_024053 [Caenorhabditis nigoni]